MAKIKKAQAGLKASTKRVGPVDPNGAWTKVQEMNLPPRNVKTKVSLTKDKQQGATKMKKGGSIKKAQMGTSLSRRLKGAPDMPLPKLTPSKKREIRKDRREMKKDMKNMKKQYEQMEPLKGAIAKGGKWIQKAIKKPGALRAQLGAKPGKPIPAAKLAKAAKAPGKLGQRARLAQTLKKMKKK